MKVTGYKIKEAIKGFERILEDTKLVATAVPDGHDEKGRQNLVDAANDLNKSFLALQILKYKILNLKQLQQVYNMKVKVNESKTLAEVIQEASVPSQLSSALAGALREIVDTEEYNVSHNRALADRTTEFPAGRRPSRHEPVLEKSVLQSAIRNLKSDETKLKNLIGYGNGVEIDLDFDKSLVQESSWEKFNADEEILKFASGLDLFGGKVVFPSGLVIDPDEMMRLSGDFSAHRHGIDVKLNEYSDDSDPGLPVKTLLDDLLDTMK
jgi:hypothetical protein